MVPKEKRRPLTPRYPSKKHSKESINVGASECTPLSILSPSMEFINTDSIARPRLILPKENYIRVAFCGTLCSEKKALCQHIQSIGKEHNIDVRCVAFGDYVKSVAKEYFQMKETNQTLLTQIETSMRAINQEVWVNCVKKNITQSKHQHWVVDDLCYENEYEMLKELGFKIIRLDISREEQIEHIQNTDTKTQVYEEQPIATEHLSGQHMISKEQFYFDEVFTSNKTKQFIQNWLYLHYVL